MTTDVVHAAVIRGEQDRAAIGAEARLAVDGGIRRKGAPTPLGNQELFDVPSRFTSPHRGHQRGAIGRPVEFAQNFIFVAAPPQFLLDAIGTQHFEPAASEFLVYRSDTLTVGTPGRVPI